MFVLVGGCWRPALQISPHGSTSDWDVGNQIPAVSYRAGGGGGRAVPPPTYPATAYLGFITGLLAIVALLYFKIKRGGRRYRQLANWTPRKCHIQKQWHYRF